MPLGANARKLRSGGRVSDDSRLAIYKTLSSEWPAPLCVAGVRYCIPYCMLSISISISISPCTRVIYGLVPCASLLCTYEVPAQFLGLLCLVTL